MMQKPLRKNPYLLLAGATLLFYLPVASLRFAIKNDMFTGYFPARFHLSTFLHEGLFPLWDPWINYGLPLYGDITAATWNPLTILIASTIGYNAYTITFEVLLALFTAGASMYALCSRMGFAARASLMTGMAYMACGYFIGDLQHLNWVWGAALLPWCANGFLHFTASGKWRDLPASLLPFFLFMTSAHPGLMIGAAYFFLFWALALCLGIGPEEQSPSGWAPLRRAGMLAGTLLLVSLGLAYGYGYNLLLTTRAPEAGAALSGQGASTAQSWISILLPFATMEQGIQGEKTFGTDIAVRNAYIGILPLILVLHALFFQRNRWTIFWTAMITFFALIAGEQGLSALLNKYLPLLGQVRLKGEYRIFAMFGALIIAASVLHRPFREFGGRRDRIASISFVGMFVFMGLALLAFIVAMATNNGILVHPHQEAGLKGFLHGLNLTDLILVQSIVQTLACFGIWKSFKVSVLHPELVLLLVVLDLTLASWMNLPFTGVGSRSVADMQALIDRSPKGIPMPENRPTIDVVASYPETDSIIGNWGLYSKQNAWKRKAPYPMLLTESRAFFPVMSDSLLGRSTVFSTRHEKGADSMLVWEPDHLAFTTNLADDITLGMKQNNHPRWQAEIDGEPAAVTSAWGGLNAIDVHAGSHRVDLYFRDPLARSAQVYHAVAFLSLLILSFVFRRKSVSVA